MGGRVAVVGGGVIGAAIAWRLAQRGAAVTVVDDRTRAGVATQAAAGMLAPLAEAHRPGPFLDLGLESLRRYPAFVAELESQTGLGVGYARAGKLIAALTAGEADDLAATHAWQSRAPGVHTELIDAATARTLEPALSSDVRAAVLIRDDHRVDNALLAEALECASRLAGATWLRARARAIRSRTDRVIGVETTAGQIIEADFVVVAAGAWAAQLEGLPRPLPIRPVRGQMLALRPARALFGRTLASAEAYLVPRADGRIIVGSTMEEAGYDASTTADAIATLREAAVRLVPGLADATRANAWSGLRPATPDGLPILGADPTLSGLVYATGHFRNGILLAPVTADAIAAAITGAPVDVDVGLYSPARLQPATTLSARGVPASREHRPQQGASIAVARATADTERARRPGAEADRLCDLCGAVMYEVHCKLVCPACGYKRDCSDLW